MLNQLLKGVCLFLIFISCNETKNEKPATETQEISKVELTSVHLANLFWPNKPISGRKNRKITKKKCTAFLSVVF